MKIDKPNDTLTFSQTEISQVNNRVDDVLVKMKAIKEQIKQMSEDQGQVIDILKSIAEKQVNFYRRIIYTTI